MCPRCGNRFANKNNWHSCNNYPIEAHFEGKPRAWDLWLCLRAAVEAMGPVALITTKSKVGFMTRVRFAGCEARKDHLRTAVWLKRRVESSRVTRVEFIPPNNYIHYFDIRDPPTSRTRRYWRSSGKPGRWETRNTCGPAGPGDRDED